LTADSANIYASYNPGTGAVTVTLPTAATNSTTISATGISTGSLSLQGGRITNVGAGTAATDAVNVGQLNTAIAGVNASIGTLNTSLNNLSSLVETNRRAANAGIATAVALSGGTFLPGKTFNLTANVGVYDGEVAIAAQLGYLVSDSIALNAGVATGVEGHGDTAFRGGITFGF
jgi:hypothetical protein